MDLNNIEGLDDIISSLNADDIEMLKGVASSILGGEASPLKQEEQSKSSLLPKKAGLDAGDFEMIMKAKTLFDKMNATSSKNVDLIMALKPHLSKETQNKADTALRILKLFEVLPLLRELF